MWPNWRPAVARKIGQLGNKEATFNVHRRAAAEFAASCIEDKEIGIFSLFANLGFEPIMTLPPSYVRM